MSSPPWSGRGALPNTELVKGLQVEVAGPVRVQFWVNKVEA
jgi:hypothetical protein